MVSTAKLFRILITAVTLSTGYSQTTSYYDWLQQQPKPLSRPGNTLKKLTRCGWPALSVEARIELAKNWGYTLDLDGWAGISNSGRLNPVEDPNSEDRKLIDLAAKDPKTYKLHIFEDRFGNNFPLIDSCPACLLKDSTGNILRINNKNVFWSPIIPDSTLYRLAKKRAEAVQRIQKFAPLAYIGNMGEYALSIPANSDKFSLDPNVVAAKGTQTWVDFISKAKAHQEIILHSEIVKTNPSLELYYWYSNGANTHTNRYGGWSQWCWLFEDMKILTEYPSSESYYKSFNHGYTGPVNSQGFDLLSGRLNSKAWEIKGGKPLSYDWVSAGWGVRSGEDSGRGDLIRWTGFMKCSYTMGMVGANTGGYENVKIADFPANTPPHWLQHIVVNARVHALFTWLEPFIRGGDLVEGDTKNPYTDGMPGYEFSTGDSSLRVLARKLRNDNRWIVTGWAAGGETRNAKVTIPGLGAITVNCRPEGTVYHASLKNGVAALSILDTDGLLTTIDTTLVTREMGDVYKTAGLHFRPRQTGPGMMGHFDNSQNSPMFNLIGRELLLPTRFKHGAARNRVVSDG